MLKQALIIAFKEIVDHMRDRRSIASSVLYALMGPAVIALILIARGPAAAPSSGAQPWPIMAAVFALLAAFSGAVGPATDMVAGERERRTLLPLVATALSRRHIIVGKWLAACLFAAGGFTVNLVAFGLVGVVSPALSPTLSWFLILPAMLSLALLAAALEILVSTLCRSTKEANTYLSLLIFVVMGVAFWLAFRPQAARGWLSVMPVLGHQRLLEAAFSGGARSFLQMAGFLTGSLLLAAVTVASTVPLLAAAWKSFERDDVLDG